MRTVADLIDRLDASSGSLAFYDRRGASAEAIPYPELARRVRAVGGRLRSSGLAPGSVLFLQLPTSPELVTTFLGAILAGLVPCCLAPPRALGGIDAFRARLRTLLAHFPEAHLVADDETGSAAGLPFLPPPPADRGGPRLAPAPVDPAQLAFVQLTSGSTRAPRAVRISHRALVANATDIVREGHAHEGESLVNWLPLYHDMGLVGGLFCGLVMGCDTYLLRPETFLARPRTWLAALGATGKPVITTAPNFAYQHCARSVKPEDAAGLDLANVRIAGCGAERVRAETLDAFARHFAGAGFRAEAFLPCYGLAEATLAVTFTDLDRVPPVHDGHVSCGRPLAGTEIEIRDPEGRPVAEGAQGEIFVRGPGLCDGYLGGAAASPIRDGWLRTGDRGVRRAGELYVTGRLKDLVIVDGVNIDPDEIEAVAEAAGTDVGARNGVFSIERDGRERVVLVMEVAEADSAVLEERAALVADGVARTFGFPLHELVCVRRGSLPKTSSGKVKRAALKHIYEEGRLVPVWRSS